MDAPASIIVHNTNRAQNAGEALRGCFQKTRSVCPLGKMAQPDGKLTANTAYLLCVSNINHIAGPPDTVPAGERLEELNKNVKPNISSQRNKGHIA